MIVVRLCGGLGNQLFQYAAGRRLAQVRRTELVLDLDWYACTPASNTPRAYELAHYPVRARAAAGAEAWWCKLHSGRFVGRAPLPRRWKNVREKNSDFDPAILELPDHAYLNGYWQSHRYFEDVAETIRSELHPLVPCGAEDRAVLELIEGSEAVSVHVRRGDYVSQRAAATVHGACTLDYYRAALSWITSRVARPHFFVFSDDSAWTRENLELPGPCTYVDHNGPAKAFQDLRLMAHCKHHVIANSTFSWWGAWLNPRPEKTVVAPKVWFADGRPTPTLIPNSWSRL